MISKRKLWVVIELKSPNKDEWLTNYSKIMKIKWFKIDLRY